jgi:hypothetical protein
MAPSERRAPEIQHSETSHGHERSVELARRHRDIIESKSGGRVHIEPAPEGLPTFATNLENGTIYVNDIFYRSQGHELSSEKTFFAILHESVGHLAETLDILKEAGGAATLERHVAKIKKSKAFGLMDNCVADIRENRTVIDRMDGIGGETEKVERVLYRENLFPDTDFTSKPRHIQFCEALLRENRISDEKCAVAPEVRAKLDQLTAIAGRDGVRLIDAMTHPDTPMSLRLKLQDRFIWPIVKELLDEDVQDKKDKPQQGADPDELFADAYAEAAKRNPHAVPIEETEKALKEYKEHHGDDPDERADQEYADKLGVEKDQLRQYRDVVKSLEQTINPETNESVIEELRSLIARIIAHRLKPAMAPRYPVVEGEELVDPAELYTQVKAGNLEPKAWETHEIRERKGQKFGEIEITLVCDRSTSMEGGTKLHEQRKAAVLLMEALKEFANRCDEERLNMDEPLEVRSEIYAFAAGSGDTKPLKSMSRELGEKERIEIASTLLSAPGQSTPDFVPLEAIQSGLSEEVRKNILEGELKKIVIVFTDGASDNPARVQRVLALLRGAGIVAIGIGITGDGAAALTTYAPDARLAERAEDLALVLGDLLKKHLADI